MPDEIERVVRQNFTKLVSAVDSTEDLDLDFDMVDDYGLTSLNKVLFLTSACEEAGVSLANFTEHDLARMRTLRDVTTALVKHSNVAG